MLLERTWLYKGQTGRVFPEGSEIPEGWSLTPEVPFAAEGEYPEVIELYHTPKAAKTVMETLAGMTPPPNPVPFEVETTAMTEVVRRGPGRPPKPVEA